jgi:hypothetical protein
MLVSEARSLIHEYVTTAGSADARVLEAINFIQERLINSGKWNGQKAEVTFANPDGFITLPRRYESILGVRFDRSPRLIYSQWHEYVSGGPGEISEEGFSVSALIDQGPGFATYADPAAECTLRVKIADANDVGEVITLRGLDANGRIIHSATGVEGITLTAANPSADTTQTFTLVTGLSKTTTEGYITLWSVIDGVETQIGEYEPGETLANYRRYKIGVVDAPETISALAKRKYIPARSDSDVVFPDNQAALIFGAKAYNYIRNDDIDRGEFYWNKVLGEVNNQSKQARGGAQQSQRISPHGLQFHRIRSHR